MRARIRAIVIGAALVPLLAGCTPTSTPEPSESASASPSASASASPAPSASPGVSASPAAGERVEEGCLELVSLDTMYAFDPNFAHDESYSADPGSLAATAVADGGVACGWVRETGGGEIVISVSKPGATKLASLREAAGSADGDAFFSLAEGSGVVQVFDGDAWITATSAYFGSAADAASLTASVSSALE